MKTNTTKTKVLTKTIYIVATPIGNLDDISNRAVKCLQEVDFIICENPKHSLKLLNNKGIKKKLLSIHDYNEKIIINKISKLKNNIKIALISDAGSPLISDPGYNLVKYFLDNNHFVKIIPGPSSIISALQLSGFPTNNFAFYGFIPKQNSKIIQFFNKIKDINLTSVIFVPAKHLITTIHNIIKHMGEREISVCKEITKINEEVFRGKPNEILKLIKEQTILLKGEFTLVVCRTKTNKLKKINNEIKKEIIRLMKKFNLTEVVKIVHSLTGISKKDIYQMAIKLKDD